MRSSGDSGLIGRPAIVGTIFILKTSHEFRTPVTIIHGRSHGQSHGGATPGVNLRADFERLPAILVGDARLLLRGCCCTRSAV
jgi:hypothetical protein